MQSVTSASFLDTIMPKTRAKGYPPVEVPSQIGHGHFYRGCASTTRGLVNMQDPVSNPASFKPLRRRETARSTVNNLSAGISSALLHVFDSKTRKYFLVDTGSELSILSPGLAKATRPSNQPLIAANGTPIKSFCTRQIELQLGLQRYSWRFIVAEVTQPIIGGNFLRSHSLLVDLANKRLIRTDNLKIIKGSRSLQGPFPRTSSCPYFVNVLG